MSCCSFQRTFFPLSPFFLWKRKFQFALNGISAIFITYKTHWPSRSNRSISLPDSFFFDSTNENGRMTTTIIGDNNDDDDYDDDCGGDGGDGNNPLRLWITQWKVWYFSHCAIENRLYVCVCSEESTNETTAIWRQHKHSIKRKKEKTTSFCRLECHSDDCVSLRRVFVIHDSKFDRKKQSKEKHWK